MWKMGKKIVAFSAYLNFIIFQWNNKEKRHNKMYFNIDLIDSSVGM